MFHLLVIGIHTFNRLVNDCVHILILNHSFSDRYIFSSGLRYIFYYLSFYRHLLFNLVRFIVDVSPLNWYMLNITLGLRLLLLHRLLHVCLLRNHRLIWIMILGLSRLVDEGLHELGLGSWKLILLILVLGH